MFENPPCLCSHKEKETKVHCGGEEQDFSDRIPAVGAFPLSLWEHLLAQMSCKFTYCLSQKSYAKNTQLLLEGKIFEQVGLICAYLLLCAVFRVLS